MDISRDFNAIVTAHGPMIARIAASYEADPHLAADLVQEVLIAVWKALPRFRGQASLRTFAARIAHNRAVTHVVRQSKSARLTELPGELPASGSGPESLAIEEDQRRRLVDAVRRLPLSYRAPVTLALEGFSIAEISETLGISVNAVGIRLTRAKALLANTLKDAR
jgi:RNA polymerase sigma-70 factor (ECF subfamily)